MLAHVLHLQRLDRLPIEVQLASHILDRPGPAPPADIEGEAPSVERIVGQPGQLLLLHGQATPAEDTPDFDLQVDARVAAGEISDATGLVVVEGPLAPSAGPTRRFFPRRTRRTIRALGSPKSPRTVGSGRKPGNRYASSRRRWFRIRVSWPLVRPRRKRKTPGKQGAGPSPDAFIYPHALEKNRRNKGGR